jgi:hypothetical protein
VKGHLAAICGLISPEDLKLERLTHERTQMDLVSAQMKVLSFKKRLLAVMRSREQNSARISAEMKKKDDKIAELSTEGQRAEHARDAGGELDISTGDGVADGYEDLEVVDDGSEDMYVGVNGQAYATGMNDKRAHVHEELFDGASALLDLHENN